MLDGLQPAFGGTSEVHGGHADPHGRLHSIHLKVVGGACDPELSMFAVKFWKIKFRKADKVGRVGNRHGMLSMVEGN